MSKIIVLQACRHGIGCSHLVANIAVVLMRRGYRVGILDTDSRGGGVRTLMGVDETSTRDLTSYWWLSFNSDVSTATLRSQWRQHDTLVDTTEAGIYLPFTGGQLTADNPHFEALQQRYGQTKVQATLQHLSQELALDYLLIDNQPETNHDNLIGLAMADAAVVMMQLDAHDFQQAAVILDVIAQLTNAKTWLVPTFVLPELAMNSVKHKLEETYHHPVAGVLYTSDEMVRLASAGVFCLHYPTHPLTQMMIAIAHQLEQETSMHYSANSVYSTKGKLGRSRKRPLLNLLEFPSLERRLLTTILRQGPITLNSLAEQSGQTFDTVAIAIEQLIQQGWVIKDPTTHKVRYHTENAAQSED